MIDRDLGRPRVRVKHGVPRRFGLLLAVLALVLGAPITGITAGEDPVAGSITLLVRACPAEITAPIDAAAMAARCPIATRDFDVALDLTFSPRGESLPGTLTFSDADANSDGSFTWPNLPFGAYHVALTALPAGYATYWLTTSAATGGSPEVGYDTTIGACDPNEPNPNTPDRTLGVYLFRAASAATSASDATPLPAPTATQSPSVMPPPADPVNPAATVAPESVCP